VNNATMAVLGQQLPHKLQSLCRQLESAGSSRGIATRAGKVSDGPTDRIVGANEDERNCRVAALAASADPRPVVQYDGRPTPNQFGASRQLIVLDPLPNEFNCTFSPST